MKTRVACVIAATGMLLASCAATQANKDALNLRGQPIDAAIARFGYPSEEKVIAGRKIYVWNRSTSGPDVNFKCEMVVEVNPQGQITNHTITGQLGACNRL